MLLKRRTVITFEKLERSFYRLPGALPIVETCPGCQTDVSWLTPNQAVALSGLSLREIFRRVESQTLHFIETPPAGLHICPKSLGLKFR